MERRTLAVWILSIGLAIGAFGTLVFYQKAIGLSFPLFIGVSILVVLAASAPAGVKLRLRNLWPLLPAMFFAVMVAVRADPSISFLNVCATLALCGLALHYLPLRRRLDEASLFEQGVAVFLASLNSLFMPIAEFFDSWAWLRQRRLQGGPAVAVVRGLLIAAPILLVFAFLLGTADVVFAKYLDQVWQVFSLNNVDTLVAQGMFTFGLGWLAVGALAYGIGRRWSEAEIEPVAQTPASGQPSDAFPIIDDDDDAAEPHPPKRKGQFITLGMIESGIILGGVAAMFAAFVLIQLAYFFGGQEMITSQGYTYSDYARRGFFELVAVSVLTLGLVLTMDSITLRQGGGQTNLFRGLSVVIIALTCVMLASAWQRMSLYEEAYGFTHLRVYTKVSMVWLGILFGAVVLSLFRLRRNVFALGALVTSIGYLGTLNLMNVDYYIAERNIHRYYDGQALDLWFLGSLSTDAVPAIMPLFQTENPGQTWAGNWLVNEFYALGRLRAAEGGTIFSANSSRDSAYQMLDALRDQLPELDITASYPDHNSRFYSSGRYEIYLDGDTNRTQPDTPAPIDLSRD